MEELVELRREEGGIPKGAHIPANADPSEHFEVRDQRSNANEVKSNDIAVRDQRYSAGPGKARDIDIAKQGYIANNEEGGSGLSMRRDIVKEEQHANYSLGRDEGVVRLTGSRGINEGSSSAGNANPEFEQFSEDTDLNNNFRDIGIEYSEQQNNRNSNLTETSRNVNTRKYDIMNPDRQMKEYLDNNLTDPPLTKRIVTRRISEPKIRIVTLRENSESPTATADTSANRNAEDNPLLQRRDNVTKIVNGVEQSILSPDISTPPISHDDIFRSSLDTGNQARRDPINNYEHSSSKDLDVGFVRSEDNAKLYYSNSGSTNRLPQHPSDVRNIRGNGSLRVHSNSSEHVENGQTQTVDQTTRESNTANDYSDPEVKLDISLKNEANTIHIEFRKKK